jgi:hypothetical protein
MNKRCFTRVTCAMWLEGSQKICLLVLLENRYGKHICKFYKTFSLCLLIFMGILNIYNQMTCHGVKYFSGQHMLFVLFSLIDCHFNQDIFHVRSSFLDPMVVNLLMQTVMKELKLKRDVTLLWNKRDITFSSNKCKSKGMHRNGETTSKVKVKWKTLLFHIHYVPERVGTCNMNGEM